MIVSFIDALGIRALSISTHVGSFFAFLWAAIRTLCTTRLKVQKTIMYMEQIGVGSLTVILLTGTSTGMVLAFQSYIGFHRFGGEEFIGPVIALGMTRELGPVLTGLMVTGRIGSAIAAEIGTMQISEQIDALRTLGISPMHYLVVPRIIASAFILPFLALFCMICGIVGGYLVSVYALGLNPEMYISHIQENVMLEDITGGLIKSSVFGLILSWVGAYRGYYTQGGAQGVGMATTQSVVLGSIMILIANYFLTAMLF